MSETSQPPVEPHSEPRTRTTSARRLLMLLALLKGANGLNAYRVLPVVMGLKATPEAVELGWPFAEGIALIGKMTSDFALEITSSGLSEEERAYHLECQPLIINAVAPVRMSVPWDQAKGAISETLISKLQSADVALRRSVTEEMLRATDLQELRESIEAALASLKMLEIPLDLKAFVSMHLLRIKTAVDEYEYRGLIGLQDALAGYLGSLGAASSEINAKASEAQKTTMTDVLAKANAVIAVAHGVVWAWPMIHAGASTLGGLLAS